MQRRIALAVALVTFITAVPVNSFTESSMGRPAVAQGGRKVKVPVDTRILIRTSDPLDPSTQQVGQRFGGKLETNLIVDDVIVAPREAIVLGRLTQARTGGNVTGGSKLALELTDILVEGTPYPITTDTLDVRSRGLGSSGRTKGDKAKMVAGVGLGALLGGAIGIGRAAGAAAAVGTGVVATATGRQELVLPSGSMIEFRLEKEASIPVTKK